jgi:hypothetical protein
VSNCILFAVLLWWRRGRRGYVLFRRSRYGPFCHALYAEIRADGSLRVVSYKPKNPKLKRVPPPLFRGSSRWGDL